MMGDMSRSSIVRGLSVVVVPVVSNWLSAFFPFLVPLFSDPRGASTPVTIGSTGRLFLRPLKEAEKVDDEDGPEGVERRGKEGCMSNLQGKRLRGRGENGLRDEDRVEVFVESAVIVVEVDEVLDDDVAIKGTPRALRCDCDVSVDLVFRVLERVWVEG
jgi:hypothetical protein